ncbi:MAG: hypothetical protein ABFD54_11330 [Armatimonadota bacterium]
MICGLCSQRYFEELEQCYYCGLSGNKVNPKDVCTSEQDRRYMVVGELCDDPKHEKPIARAIFGYLMQRDPVEVEN